MKKTIKNIVLAFLCLNFWQTTLAQTNAIAPLRNGDKLPDRFWTQPFETLYEGKKTTQTLAAYRGKLIILDFWATWCGSCIKKFPMADSLQKIYGDRLAIILVNCKNVSDTPDKIAALMERFHNNLFTITGDTLLTKYFPHAVIPHYVWIESDQYRASSGTEFFTQQNIEATFDRRSVIEANKKKNLEN